MPFFSSFLNFIERAGNRLPDPVMLFAWLIGFVMVGSWISSLIGVSVAHPLGGEAIVVQNLFEPEALRRLFVEMPRTFSGFAPLGLVLVVMLGVGVAEQSGLIGTVLKRLASAVPPRLMTATLVFLGVMSSLAADAGYVVLVPLGAALFLGLGRHPVAGLAATFAGVSGGFTANLIPTALDPLLGGISTEAARILDPAYEVSVTANYYLMLVLVPVYTLLGTIVTERIIEPRLGKYEGRPDLQVTSDLTADDRRGMRWAGFFALAMLALVLWGSLVPGSVFRDADGDIKPLLDSLVGLLFLFFLGVGIAFGAAARKIRSQKDVVDMMAGSMSDMSLYIVLAFFAAHFIALFSWSNMGAVFAIGGANGLRQLGFDGMPLIIALIMLTSFINLFVGSASAKWGLMGPILIPMLMLLGYSPEFTQAAYRIGDSATNMVTPIMVYFPIILVYAQRYLSHMQIGSLLAVMVPYSIVFWIGSVIVLLVFVGLGLPLGPEVPTGYAIDALQ